MGIRHIISLIWLAAAFVAAAQTPAIFEKKGKYGLAERNTGKVILKAKYDSIYPFKDNLAIVKQKNKYGVVTNQGRFAIACKYFGIVPTEMHHDTKNCFWVKEKDGSYYLRTSNYIFTDPYDQIFLGPDKNWYVRSASSDHRIYQFTSYCGRKPTDWKEFPAVWELPGGYRLFNGEMYRKKETKPMLSNVADPRKVSVDGEDYLLMTVKGIPHLLSLSNERLWEKTDRRSGLDGTYRLPSPENIMIINGNQTIKGKPFSNTMPEVLLMNHTEYELLGLSKNDRKLLPFKFTKISLDTHFGRQNDSDVWALILESQSPVSDDELEAIVAELRQAKYDKNFIIIAKSSMGTSLFNNEGREIVHMSLDRVRFKDDIMYVTINGKETDMNQNGNEKEPDMNRNGNSEFSDYDSFYSFYENTSGPEFIVTRNGKKGLYERGKGEIIPPLYDSIERLSVPFRMYLLVRKNGLEGLFSIDGTKIYDPAFKEISYHDSNFGKKITVFFSAINKAGKKVWLDDSGRMQIPGGSFDRTGTVDYSGNWCVVYKNDKLGILNLMTMKVTVPCVYDSENWFDGSGSGKNQKIGVYKSTPRGNTVDIWTVGGQKLTSRYFPIGTSIYTIKRFLENTLDTELTF